MAKKAKFVSVDEGEYGFFITGEGKLQIIEVETEEVKTYSKDLVEELMDFLNMYWDD